MPVSPPNYRPSFLPTKQERDVDFKRVRQDKEQQRFYNSRTWRKFRLVKLSANPWCEIHEKNGEYVAATIVHHEREIKSQPEFSLSLENLQSLCKNCHSELHARKSEIRGNSQEIS